MTIQTKVTVDGTEYSDYQRASVKITNQDSNASSNYRIIYDNPFGRHATDFTVGDEIIIYADKDTTPVTKLLTGVVEKIKFEGKGNTQKVTLSGKDFSLRLQDSTVEPVVYTNSEVSTIVTDIMTNNVQDITVTNVQVTTTTLERISFNQVSVFQALKELAELSGFTFYVDTDKDLHFKPKNVSSSGITLDNTNILQAVSQQTREGMANKIWVYGDRYLSGYNENVATDGGSAYTLEYKPHNTLLEYLGSPQIGAVYQMTLDVTSGPDYFVNFYDKEIIFNSGTDIGYSSIPTAGGSIIVNYDRELPIVKYGQDNASISLYGPKTKVIDDKSIKDPNTAKQILQSELDNSSIFKGIELNIDGWHSITPGDTAEVVLSDFDIDTTVGILEAEYSFDKNSIQSGKILKIKLDKKILDINDEFVNVRNRLNAIESSERKDSDVISRLEQSSDTFQVVGSYWSVATRTLGSSFIVGHPYHGVIGSPAPIQGGTEQVVIGDSRSPLSVLRSGGYF